MTEKAPVFEKIYKDYLDQIVWTDIRSDAERLGIRTEGDEIIIPFFGKPYSVSAKGIADPSGNKPIHAVNVILCKYLLLCPDAETFETLKTSEISSEWVSYRDFKDAAPFAGAFANNTEQAIAENFSGRPEALKTASRRLGGRVPDIDLSCDFSMIFDALPRVPLLLLFNDADDEFPAQCSVLFEKRAEKYLDMECLAMAGWLLSDYLTEAVGGSGALNT
ncbi:DUF3786 domain-containing protein [Desulfonema magnum]|uniref:DUF3786 n=1 Tax=Desulfonema magnum TaxID=45655 RepID=A0A975GSJ4_9BACT|nr:DUF3786 domain-containing protein [Desulfonema magnum]QTA92099.1 DUF3786 [Desulfonema magnum]